VSVPDHAHDGAHQEQYSPSRNDGSDSTFEAANSISRDQRRTRTCLQEKSLSDSDVNLAVVLPPKFPERQQTLPPDQVMFCLPPNPPFHD